MEKIQYVFLKALETAEEISRNCLVLLRKKAFEKALDQLDNRGRVVNIILHLDEQIRLAPEAEQDPALKDRASRSVKIINQLDEEIFELLVAEKLITQNEIAKTRKNKENLKGYNLNNLK